MKLTNLFEKVDPTSKRFKQWFGNSKVVDKDGNPMVVYHGTSSPINFTALRALTHFGPLKAAHQFVGGAEPAKGRIFPVYLKIERPIEMLDTGDSFHDAMGLLVDIRDHESTPEPLKRAIHKRFEQRERDGKWIRTPEVVALLKAHGYDGIFYVNHAEDWGSTAWVIFDPSQVKYVYAE